MSDGCEELLRRIDRFFQHIVGDASLGPAMGIELAHLEEALCAAWDQRRAHDYLLECLEMLFISGVLDGEAGRTFLHNWTCRWQYDARRDNHDHHDPR